MTMRTASTFMTPCEVARQINDLCQSDSKKDKIIRLMAARFEKMAKKLAREVNNRPGMKINDKWWDEETLNFDKLAEWRISDDYKQEGSKK